MTDDRERNWHLDKRVPLALIFAIVCQTAAILIWGTRIDSRVEMLERQLSSSGSQGERIIRLEIKMDGIFQSLADIKALMQRTPPP